MPPQITFTDKRLQRLKNHSNKAFNTAYMRNKTTEKHLVKVVESLKKAREVNLRESREYIWQLSGVHIPMPKLKRPNSDPSYLGKSVAVTLPTPTEIKSLMKMTMNKRPDSSKKMKKYEMLSRRRLSTVNTSDLQKMKHFQTCTQDDEESNSGEESGKEDSPENAREELSKRQTRLLTASVEAFRSTLSMRQASTESPSLNSQSRSHRDNGSAPSRKASVPPANGVFNRNEDNGAGSLRRPGSSLSRLQGHSSSAMTIKHHSQGNRPSSVVAANESNPRQFRKQVSWGEGNDTEPRPPTSGGSRRPIRPAVTPIIIPEPGQRNSGSSHPVSSMKKSSSDSNIENLAKTGKKASTTSTVVGKNVEWTSISLTDSFSAALGGRRERRSSLTSLPSPSSPEKPEIFKLVEEQRIEEEPEDGDDSEQRPPVVRRERRLSLIVLSKFKSNVIAKKVSMGKDGKFDMKKAQTINSITQEEEDGENEGQTENTAISGQQDTDKVLRDIIGRSGRNIAKKETSKLLSPRDDEGGNSYKSSPTPSPRTSPRMSPPSSSPLPTPRSPSNSPRTPRRGPAAENLRRSVLQRPQSSSLGGQRARLDPGYDRPGSASSQPGTVAPYNRGLTMSVEAIKKQKQQEEMNQRKQARSRIFQSTSSTRTRKEINRFGGGRPAENILSVRNQLAGEAKEMGKDVQTIVAEYRIVDEETQEEYSLFEDMKKCRYLRWGKEDEKMMELDSAEPVEEQLAKLSMVIPKLPLKRTSGFVKKELDLIDINKKPN